MIFASRFMRPSRVAAIAHLKAFGDRRDIADRAVGHGAEAAKRLVHDDLIHADRHGAVVVPVESIDGRAKLHAKANGLSRLCGSGAATERRGDRGRGRACRLRRILGEVQTNATGLRNIRA